MSSSNARRRYRPPGLSDDATILQHPTRSCGPCMRMGCDRYVHRMLPNTTTTRTRTTTPTTAAIAPCPDSASSGVPPPLAGEPMPPELLGHWRSGSAGLMHEPPPKLQLVGISFCVTGLKIARQSLGVDGYSRQPVDSDPKKHSFWCMVIADSSLSSHCPNAWLARSLSATFAAS